MKKIKLALLALFIAAAGTAQAQSLDFGLRAGLSQSNYKISGFDGVSNEQGYNVGITLRAKLAFLEVTPEINYTRSRYEINNPLILGVTGDVVNHSVDVPIAAGMTFFRLLTIEAGPRFTLYDEAKIDSNYGKFSLGPTSTDVGYLVGAKVTFTKLSVGIRYNGQFGSYETNFKDRANGMREIRNNTYSVYLGLRM